MERRLGEFFGKPDLEGLELTRSLVVLEPHRYRLLRTAY